jgi:branched-chain amino acid transport system ATP-binding protein
LTSISVSFGALRALDGVSLRLEARERRAVIGPNGAGKTTLFNVISGEIPASSGVQSLLGADMGRMPPHRRAALGLGRTYQITNIFPGLTVRENLRLAAAGCTRRKFSLFGAAHGNAAMEGAIDRALRTCGIDARQEHRARELSYGEQRQLELALALAMQPKVLLLDEPAAGLSPAERVGMAATIRELPRDLTLLLIEHDLDLALGLVDQVTCLHLGKVLTEGTPDGIRNDPLVQEVYLGNRGTHA